MLTTASECDEDGVPPRWRIQAESDTLPRPKELELEHSVTAPLPALHHHFVDRTRPPENPVTIHVAQSDTDTKRKIFIALPIAFVGNAERKWVGMLANDIERFVLSISIKFD